MRLLIIPIMCLLLSQMYIHSASSMQDVGEDFGKSWLENYGSMPVTTLENQKNLWSWGGVPKGYRIYNGMVFPPGYGPEWYYPSFLYNSSPIIINNTASDNYLLPNSRISNPNYMDGWLFSQLSGQPVMVINMPTSTLF